MCAHEHCALPCLDPNVLRLAKPPLGVTMMPLGAPSISKYGSLGRPNAQVGGMFARRAPGALLLHYVPPEEPPSTPLGNALRIR